jgi:DNA-binding transcriptional ArsR family regulator
MQSNAGKAASFLRTLGNAHRLRILCELLGGERSVGELEGPVGLSQSALSQHLARLRRERLVATRREAQTIRYRLADPAVTRTMSLLYELYCAPARPMRQTRGEGHVR